METRLSPAKQAFASNSSWVSTFLCISVLKMSLASTLWDDGRHHPHRFDRILTGSGFH
jgi:hypothetical protein